MQSALTVLQTCFPHRPEAESEARDAPTAERDQDLAELLTAWPMLPKAARLDVLGIVREAVQIFSDSDEPHGGRLAALSPEPSTSDRP
ncbi:MAG: hypothetical protein AAGI46_09895 [Planctomycetota bacterium]